MIYQAIIPSPLGKIRITGSDSGISRVSFWREDTETDLANEVEKEGWYALEANQIPDCLKECARQLDEYFEGTRKEFDLRFDFGDAPEFHKEVWKMVRLIPYGRTRTYADIAEVIDHQHAYRAVGHANGMNPLPILIPCHRVIGKDGSLTGYAYGLEMKRWLLSHESPGQYMKQGDLVEVLEAAH